jgi:chaperonin GroEL
VNALTGEDCDLVAEGILDPAKVVKASLLNAASVATMMLMTDTLIQIQDD